MGKSKALETALNNKLLGSHEHLKKGLFSPTRPVCPERSAVRRNPLPSRRVQRFIVLRKVNPAQQSIHGRVTSSRHSDCAVKLIFQQLVPLLRKQGSI